MKLPAEFKPMRDDSKMREILQRVEDAFRSHREALAALDFPDIKPDGTFIPGNINCKLVDVTFTEAKADKAVVHGLGTAPSNWFIVSRKYYDADGNRVNPTDFVDFQDGFSAPGDNVIYIRAMFSPPVTSIRARVFVSGSKRTTR